MEQDGDVASLKARIGAFINASQKYTGLVQKTVDSLLPRFVISIDDLRTADPGLALALVRRPVETLLAFEDKLKEVLTDRDPSFFSRTYAKKHQFMGPGSGKNQRMSVGFEGHIGDGQQVTPRSLSARHLSSMVAVHGIVTRVSLVRPKVARSVHYCPATAAFESREYRDATDLAGMPTGSVYPTKDAEGNDLETEFGLSTYKDSQTVTIQEMPESAPLGQLPRSVDVALDCDLVDTVKPGDRVGVYGIYRALAGVSAGASSNGNFRTMLLANNVRKLGKDASNLVLTDTDEDNITHFGGDGKDGRPSFAHFDLLARSLAPSIYGHKVIKQSLALLLAGGNEHNLENGTHIRGDINLLMVGDPSTAKSQLLRFVLNIAPVAVNTTGRGSSGVGLTAAVTTDPETGERRLEAGAMVLADRGVVCIDEFDKMSDADRVSIHEVMEQQTVTIAKAGIQASLNARCSVVAAANPVYGRFDASLPLAKNVALPDSLLSRFDLLFIVRDVVEKSSDLRLAEHVLRMHRYQRPGQEGLPVRLDATLQTEQQEDEKNPDGTSPVYIKYNPLLHGGIASELGPGEQPRLLSLDFIRKYLHYVKAKFRPNLTSKARQKIVEAYNDFRQRTEGRATLITARSLETVIRLATAHAKLRLSTQVKMADVAQAVRIMRFALYGREEEDERKPSSGAPATPPRGGAPPPPGGRKGGDDDEEGKGPKGDFDFVGDTPTRAGAKRRGGAAAAEGGGEEGAEGGVGGRGKRARGGGATATATTTTSSSSSEQQEEGAMEVEGGHTDSPPLELSFLGGGSSTAASASQEGGTGLGGLGTREEGGGGEEEEGGERDLAADYLAYRDSGKPSASRSSGEYKLVLRAMSDLAKSCGDALLSLDGDVVGHLRGALPALSHKVDDPAWLFPILVALDREANKIMVDANGFVSLV